jgi:hypothetical protein
VGQGGAVLDPATAAGAKAATASRERRATAAVRFTSRRVESRIRHSYVRKCAYP